MPHALALDASDVGTHPYALPRIYFPADSVLPMRSGAPDEALATRLHEVAGRLAAAHERLTQVALTPAARAQVLAAVAGPLQALAADLAPCADALRDTSRDASEAAVAEVLAAEHGADLARLLGDYTVQDRYFEVYRVPGMTLAAFVWQTADLGARVVADLRHALLSADEVAAVLDALALVVAGLGHRVGGEAPPRPHAPSARPGEADAHRAASDPFAPFWDAGETADADARTRDVAYYRWLAGHHLWKTLLIVGRVALDEAADAVGQGAEADAAGALLDAGRLLRATAAAMWYAAESPSRNYRDDIRPSMVALAQKAGVKSFSGVQSADHTRYKGARDRARAACAAAYGDDLAAWPDAVYAAMRNYHMVDIHCEEQHVLIAFSKVGDTAPSLAQQMKQSRLPSTVRPMSAVDVLRQMAEMKRREMPF